MTRWRRQSYEDAPDPSLPVYSLLELAYMATQVRSDTPMNAIPGYMPSRLVNVLGRAVLDCLEDDRLDS